MADLHALPDCQIDDKHRIADTPLAPISLARRVKLWARKALGPDRLRALRVRLNRWKNRVARARGKPTQPPAPVDPALTITLKAGDRVRVRSKDEIAATLDHFSRLRGCAFAREMAEICGTEQTVLKPVERFMDERDFRARRAKGIVLLEGSTCHGGPGVGQCDRNCYFFWRVEWLEKVDGGEDGG